MQGYIFATLLLTMFCFYTDSQSNSKNRLVPYLQVDDIDSGLYDNARRRPNNSCTRTCVRGSRRTCYYRFVLENYVTMGKACNDCLTNIDDCRNKGCVTADGFEKAILTVNRRLPAPSIQVCEGDLVVVDVKNKMVGRSTAIHWHGLKLRNNNHMDGVPMVTQCPIHEADIFRYTFVAEDPGLHFYHSHDGLQKVDGIVGSLVVRQPRAADPNADRYDFDLPSHVIMIQDWYHMTADSQFPGLRYRDTEQVASSYLIQGKGQFLLNDGTRIANTPLAQFTVSQGYRYVFRIIAGTCYECQYQFTIQNHDFLVIGADANPTEPYLVNSLTMSAGERYSIVVNCNKPVAAYWIQVRAVGLCYHMEANQVGVLWYRGASRTPSTTAPIARDDGANNPGITLSPVNSDCSDETLRAEGPCLDDLRSATRAPAAIRRPQPHMRIVWAYGFHFFSDEELFQSNRYYRFIQSPFDPVSSTINGISNTMPPSPILSQPDDVPESLMCPAGGFRADTWNVRNKQCFHIMRVPADSVIEIVSIDIDDFMRNLTSHPVHLHGYDMYIIEMGILQRDIPYNESYVQFMRYLESDSRPAIPENPLMKDTFPLTAGGYVVSRIYTDNPGYWFFHCHFAYHLDSGMSGVLQVGDPSTFPSPPAGFPTCGDYLPVPETIY